MGTYLGEVTVRQKYHLMEKGIYSKEKNSLQREVNSFSLE